MISQASDRSPIFFGVYGLTFSHETPFDGSSGKSVLKEVSFEIDKGQGVALIGPNGAGKSTLLQLISGIRKEVLHRRFSFKNSQKKSPVIQEECSGLVRYLGTDLSHYSDSERARILTYVGAEAHSEFPLTAKEVVALGRTCWNLGSVSSLNRQDDEYVEQAMKDFHCDFLANRNFETLSGGEKQRVSLARALAQNPKLLLLDESLSKMDLNYQNLIAAVLREKIANGLSVIWVSHDVNLALQWVDSAMLLNQGKLEAFGKVDQVIQPEKLEKLYPGVSLHIRKHPKTQNPQIDVI